MAKQCPVVLSWHVGPSGVGQIAAKFRRAGFRATAGTERVYVGIPRRLAEYKGCDRSRIGEAVLDAVKRSAGTKFGLKSYEAAPSYNVDITLKGSRRRRRR